jgi:hypothetical protein
MRSLISFLVALVFVLHSSWLLAAPTHACCHDADCPMTQCISAACLPADLPGAVGNPQPPDIEPLHLPVAPVASVSLPHPAKEIWTPPD